MKSFLVTLVAWLLILSVPAGYAGVTTTVVLHNPHDVDRLADGHTLITDGGYPGGKQAGNDSKVLEVDPNGSVVWSFATGLNFALGAAGLPDNHPNTAPADWSDVNTYCIPEIIDKGIYQLAAIRQMADRCHSK